jgi:hypothetical protein
MVFVMSCLPWPMLLLDFVVAALPVGDGEVPSPP